MKKKLIACFALAVICMGCSEKEIQSAEDEYNRIIFMEEHPYVNDPYMFYTADPVGMKHFDLVKSNVHANAIFKNGLKSDCLIASLAALDYVDFKHNLMHKPNFSGKIESGILTPTVNCVRDALDRAPRAIRDNVKHEYIRIHKLTDSKLHMDIVYAATDDAVDSGWHIVDRSTIIDAYVSIICNFNVDINELDNAKEAAMKILHN